MPLPDVVVNRSSPVPLYFQVAEQLERAIFEGALVPGDRIANEVALAAQLGLSRPTMRQAIQLLVDKGMLVRKRGVGTQVVHGQVKRTSRRSSAPSSSPACTTTSSAPATGWRRGCSAGSSSPRTRWPPLGSR